MNTIKVVYGSTTGNTERAADLIADKIGGVCLNIADAVNDDFIADLLILGVSTWGIGELQEDWEDCISKLSKENLKGQKVALFGLGDQSGFSDTFIDGVGTLYEKASGCGAKIIGKWSVDGYDYNSSTADLGGVFAGLALDDDNEPEKTEKRISQWVEQLKTEAVF